MLLYESKTCENVVPTFEKHFGQRKRRNKESKKDFGERKKIRKVYEPSIKPKKNINN